MLWCDIHHLQKRLLVCISAQNRMFFTRLLSVVTCIIKYKTHTIFYSFTMLQLPAYKYMFIDSLPTIFSVLCANYILCMGYVLLLLM